MGCSSSQSDFLSEYESKREEPKSKYYSNLLNSIHPNILNAGYVPNVRKQTNGSDSGKYKIGTDNLPDKEEMSKIPKPFIPNFVPVGFLPFVRK